MAPEPSALSWLAEGNACPPEASGSSSSLNSVESARSGDGAWSTAETVEEVQQALFGAVCAEDRDLLAQILDKSNPGVVLRALLTFQYDNSAAELRDSDKEGRMPTFRHDPEVLQDAQELLGAEVNELNIIQCACFLGEEDLAIDIIRYVDIQTGRMGTRKILYELLGRVWGRGNTTLHLASFLGMADLVRVLITLGSNTNKRNDRKYKPVDCADDDSTRSLFLTAAEDGPLLPRPEPPPDLRKGHAEDFNSTPIKSGSVSLTLSPEGGPSINSSSSSAGIVTPTTPSSLKSGLWTTRPVRKKPGKVKFDAQTLLIEAAQNGDLPMLRNVLGSTSAAEPELQLSQLHQISLEQTLLHLAAANDHLESCKFLVTRGASVNAQDAEGWTPLHCAAYEGHEDVVRYICEEVDDVDFDVVNEDGEIAAEAAEEHPCTQKLILDAMMRRRKRMADAVEPK